MTDERPGISPAEDPYEFDWPDDAKEERAAQRAAEAERAYVKPAPLLLSAIVIGIGMVFAFMLPVAFVGGALPGFVAFAGYVAIAGVTVALIPALLLERVSRTWRRGLPEVAFLVLGLVIGGGWTWLLLSSVPGIGIEPTRGAVFMATAVAASFFSARAWAEPFRHYPRYVYTLAAVIGMLTISSFAMKFVG